MSAILQEVLSVETDYPSLVRLGYVREYRVHHAHQHSVREGGVREAERRYRVDDWRKSQRESSKLFQHERFSS